MRKWNSGRTGLYAAHAVNMFEVVSQKAGVKGDIAVYLGTAADTAQSLLTRTLCWPPFVVVSAPGEPAERRGG